MHQKRLMQRLFLKQPESDGTTTVRLAQGETNVAPLNEVTNPQLEPCEAHCGQAQRNRLRELEQYVTKCHVWTDSQIVLHRLNQPSHQLKTLVADRVANIQHKTAEGGHEWHWVHDELNLPALPQKSCPKTTLQHCTLVERSRVGNAPKRILTRKPHAEASDIMNEAIIETKTIDFIMIPPN